MPLLKAVTPEGQTVFMRKMIEAPLKRSKLKSCSGVTVRPRGAPRHLPCWIQIISEGPQCCWGAVSISYLEDDGGEQDDDGNQGEKDSNTSDVALLLFNSALCFANYKCKCCRIVLKPPFQRDHLLCRIERGISTRPWCSSSGRERGETQLCFQIWRRWKRSETKQNWLEPDPRNDRSTCAKCILQAKPKPAPQQGQRLVKPDWVHPPARRITAVDWHEGCHPAKRAANPRSLGQSSSSFSVRSFDVWNPWTWSDSRGDKVLALAELSGLWKPPVLNGTIRAIKATRELGERGDKRDQPS